MNIKLTLCLCAFLLTISLHSQTFVSTDTDLQNMVNASNDGDVFIVPDGTYSDFYASITKVATAGNPVTIKAETVGGVTLTGDSHFVFKKAAHIILEGFVFDCVGNNTLVKLEASNNIRITRNVFETETTNSLKWIVVTGYYNDYTFQFLSHHNRIDHNIFQNKDTAGNYITIDGTYNEDRTVNQQSQYDRIDHNYFFNNGPRIANEKESIRIGNSQLSTTSGFTTVEFNYFEECDGDPEIVSVKSCDNIVRHNTFYRNYGTLTLRQGNRNTVAGNYFFGGGKANGVFIDNDGQSQPIYTGGIRAYGTDHIIINNYLEDLRGTRFDAPITLTQGDAIDGVDTNQSLHYRGERITIANNTLVNNTHNIEIGYAKQNGSYNQPLVDIVLANNLVTGSENSMVKYYNDQYGEIEWYNNVMYPTASAVLNADGYSFTSDEISVENHNLALSGDIWKATSTTPTRENGASSITNDEDIEGQTRPVISSVGADHFSTSAVVYEPIGIDDVGPYAYEGTLSVIQNEFTSNIKLFPNPASQYFTIQSEEKQIESIHIYAISGKMVKDVKDFSSTIDVSDLANGLYLVKIKTPEALETHKLIIK
ncbi:chondroitinase-B domain-containing protein [Corallibacter sp.]|uniref:chondroitinase-B domain-containing protein n=1 Tax=Corallibacter sp. TaxID=2038084 RepID=UPI003A927EDA